MRGVAADPFIRYRPDRRTATRPTAGLVRQYSEWRWRGYNRGNPLRHACFRRTWFEQVPIEIRPFHLAAPAASAAESKPAVRSGCAIQVGAFEEEAEAKQRLSAAQSKASSVLKKADPYKERTTKGEKVYYRARFAGFDRDQAQAACKQLKRSDIACMALKI